MQLFYSVWLHLKLCFEWLDYPYCAIQVYHPSNHLCQPNHTIVLTIKASGLVLDTTHAVVWWRNFSLIFQRFVGMLGLHHSRKCGIQIKWQFSPKFSWIADCLWLNYVLKKFSAFRNILVQQTLLSKLLCQCPCLQSPDKYPIENIEIFQNIYHANNFAQPGLTSSFNSFIFGSWNYFSPGSPFLSIQLSKCTKLVCMVLSGIYGTSYFR